MVSCVVIVLKAYRNISVAAFRDVICAPSVAGCRSVDDNNGEISRLSIPPLTEERRKQLVKQCGKEVEQAKISVRNARRDIIEKLKKGIKDGLAEDAEKDAEAKLQKMHDKYIKQIDELYDAKEKEIMTV